MHNAAIFSHREGQSPGICGNVGGPGGGDVKCHKPGTASKRHDLTSMESKQAELPGIEQPGCVLKSGGGRGWLTGSGVFSCV